MDKLIPRSPKYAYIPKNADHDLSFEGTNFCTFCLFKNGKIHLPNERELRRLVTGKEIEDVPGIPIKNFPDYSITRDGRIFDCKTGNELRIEYGRYKYVKLSKNGTSKMKYVHFLLAQVYLPNPENLPFINHKDGNKWNNTLSNLEWYTQIKPTRPAPNPKKKTERVSSKGVLQIRATERLGEEKTYLDAAKAEQETGVPINDIHLACQKKTAIGGYFWESFPNPGKRRKIRSIKIITIEKVIKKFDDIDTASQETGIHSNDIFLVCKGELKSAGGYRWRYSDPNSEWRPIPGFPKYKISRDGRIFSLHLMRELSPSVTKQLKSCNGKYRLVNTKSMAAQVFSS